MGTLSAKVKQLHRIPLLLALSSYIVFHYMLGEDAVSHFSFLAIIVNAASFYVVYKYIPRDGLLRILTIVFAAFLLFDLLHSIISI